ncbi:MAG: hypothetical protein AVDCRST_MAG68-2922 [uncultured Gemmatimonadetes bacterium]|uniref:Uncharacterized protein n=1 Tax=uncultured Gemmatimonadota bacterium TaxID=203437 RepID=A0A6J4LR87_9BACT|nr:MAG: hypothetical protein AVDCRST_MAG68-2922 [uncultured Gemmatimonadota bacterium]
MNRPALGGVRAGLGGCKRSGSLPGRQWSTLGFEDGSNRGAHTETRRHR